MQKRKETMRKDKKRIVGAVWIGMDEKGYIYLLKKSDRSKSQRPDLYGRVPSSRDHVLVFVSKPFSWQGVSVGRQFGMESRGPVVSLTKKRVNLKEPSIPA